MEKQKKSFSSFQGTELALFVAHTETIIEFLQSQLESTNELEDFVSVLRIWKKIFKFLGITYIEDVQYQLMVEDFCENVRKLYDHGSRTFFSSPASTDEKEETLYTNTLSFYMPDIVSATFQNHGSGVGIFTIQSFERRNKESKNCLR